MRAFLIAMALVLGGCASHSSGYTRADGVSVDPLHEQATLAQCKGEGVSGAALTDGTVYGAVAQARKETMMQTAFQIVAFAVGIGAAGVILATRTESGPRSFLADLISAWSIMAAAFIGPARAVCVMG